MRSGGGKIEGGRRRAESGVEQKIPVHGDAGTKALGEKRDLSLEHSSDDRLGRAIKGGKDTHLVEGMATLGHDMRFLSG